MMGNAKTVGCMNVRPAVFDHMLVTSILMYINTAAGARGQVICTNQ